MRRRDHVKKEENVSYWQSYSDMMAALLLIFVLVIAVAIVALNDYKKNWQNRMKNCWPDRTFLKSRQMSI